jgi:hypothetical protein
MVRFASLTVLATLFFFLNFVMLFTLFANGASAAVGA